MPHINPAKNTHIKVLFVTQSCQSGMSAFWSCWIPFFFFSLLFSFSEVAMERAFYSVADTFSISIWGMAAPVPPRSVAFALGFLV